MIYPRVKDIINKYIEGGIPLLITFLNREDVKIEDISWVNEIKKHLDKKEFLTATAKIELVKYKLQLFKNKDHDEKKSSEEC
jgi:hypothetical protein